MVAKSRRSRGDAKRARHKPQRDRFVAEYLIDMNATEAAKRCGYSPKTARQQGARLLSDPAIAAQIAAGQVKLVEKAEVKAEDVIRRWDQRARSSAADFLRFDIVRHRPRIWVTAAEAVERLQIELVIEQAGLTAGDNEDRVQSIRVRELRRDLARVERRAEFSPDYMVEVEGEMVEEVKASFDLVRLRDAGRLDLVKSVKEDTDGSYTVVMHDAAAADEALAKHLGMFVTKHQQLDKDGNPTDPPTAISVTLVRADGTAVAIGNG